MMVNTDIFESHLSCKYKTYLRLRGKTTLEVEVLTQNPAGLPPRVGELVLSESKGLRPPAPVKLIS